MSRYELWKDWCKHCTNHPVYKFLVLIGLIRNSSFEIHAAVKEKMDQYQSWNYTVHDDWDDDEEEPCSIRWGWYIGYLFVVFVNSIMCSIHGFGINTWQYWVHTVILILSFVSGANYRKGED